MEKLLIQTTHKRKNPIIECTERSARNCLKRFIATRRDQPDICIPCLHELGIEEAFPIIKIGEKNSWKIG